MHCDSILWMMWLCVNCWCLVYRRPHHCGREPERQEHGAHIRNRHGQSSTQHRQVFTTPSHICTRVLLPSGNMAESSVPVVSDWADPCFYPVENLVMNVYILLLMESYIDIDSECPVMYPRLRVSCSKYQMIRAFWTVFVCHKSLSKHLGMGQNQEMASIPFIPIP